MTQVELIEEISKTTGISKTKVLQVLKTFVSVTTRTTKTGEKVHLTGFGSFATVSTKARGIAKNRDGEWVSLKFHPSRSRRGTWKSSQS